MPLESSKELPSFVGREDGQFALWSLGRIYGTQGVPGQQLPPNRIVERPAQDRVLDAHAADRKRARPPVAPFCPDFVGEVLLQDIRPKLLEPEVSEGRANPPADHRGVLLVGTLPNPLAVYPKPALKVLGHGLASARRSRETLA